jgi:hypothetical protein
MPTQVYYSEIVNLIVIFVNKYNPGTSDRVQAALLHAVY